MEGLSEEELGARNCKRRAHAPCDLVHVSVMQEDMNEMNDMNDMNDVHDVNDSNGIYVYVLLYIFSTASRGSATAQVYRYLSFVLQNTNEHLVEKSSKSSPNRS